MDLNILRSQAETTDTLTEEIYKTLYDFINYNSTGMRVTVTEVLNILKTRIENGEEIKFYTAEEPMSVDEFKGVVLATFGEQIFEDVFNTEIK